MKPGSEVSILGISALLSVAVGGIGSIVFTHLVGRHNNSIVLAVFFSVWVASPFVGNAWVWFTIARSSVLAWSWYYSSMLAVSLGSLVIYGLVALGARMAKPGFPFLITPLVSWIVVALVTASLLSKIRNMRAPNHPAEPASPSQAGSP